MFHVCTEVVPSGEGIIRTMGFADFNCSDGDLCSIAHTAADTGGEFAAAKMVDLKWYPQVILIDLAWCVRFIRMRLLCRGSGTFPTLTW
jgi:hypothetical protein